MKYKKVIIIILSCILLSGCWDKVEIDRRSLISIISVDIGEQAGKEKELKNLSPDEPFTGMDLKKLKVTFGAPDISQLGPDKGGTAKDMYITTDAYSMQDAVNKAALKSSRDISFSHIKLLVLSKDLTTYPEILKEIVDYLQREPSLNRNMYVVISDGKAEEYIKHKPRMEKNIENYISGLIENTTRSTSILPVTLNEFLILLSENGNAMLPRMTIEKDKNELGISGVGIIKDYKYKGDLSAIETANLEMLRGKLKGGRKTIYKNGHPIDVVIDSAGRKISMDNQQGKLTFNIYLDIEGELKDYYVGGEVFSKDMLQSLQQNLNNSVKQECAQVVQITQRELGVDPIGIREYIEKYHPSLWKQIKNNWSEVYSSATINVIVNSNIRRIGVVK
ncbi:Ger(x)C family spore germination protein [Clostridium aciditolerans]|uniref:Ger(X)C family spore germination protein n=1 Tax=Clostridium aciditolerans TaxID=339861 RepID=A0A934HTJ2_9CLOT|nr:Ger(x)C family spore germination protein [Clostridium aciditolerans]MBI6874055.1 Ger(x)C family spore germination protein [Clostridium aciditolerans]